MMESFVFVCTFYYYCHCSSLLFSHLGFRTFGIRSTSGLESMAYCDKLFILFPVWNVYETMEDL